MTQPKKTKTNYIDKEEFSLAVHKFNMYQKNSLTRVQPPDKIGVYFLLLTKNIAKCPKFCRYTYKEDMMMFGVEMCVRYMHNYDYSKGYSAYSYFTQTIFNAFIQYIKKENRQRDIKEKIVERFPECTFSVSQS